MKFKFLFVVGVLLFAMAGDLFSHQADPNLDLAQYAIYASNTIIYGDQAHKKIEMPRAGLVGTNGNLDMKLVPYNFGGIHFYGEVKVGGQIQLSDEVSPSGRYQFDSPIASSNQPNKTEIKTPYPVFLPTSSFTPPVTNSTSWGNVWPAGSINAHASSVQSISTNQSMAPGSYGKVVVQANKTLTLSAGVYEMRELVLMTGAVVMIDKAEVEFTRIFVRDNLEFSELGGSQKILTKIDGDYGKVLLYTTATNIKTPLASGVAYSITLEVSLVAPLATIVFRNNPIFRGQLLAKRIEFMGDFNAAEGSFQPFVTSNITLVDPVNAKVREDTSVVEGDDDNVPLTDRSWTKNFEVLLGSQLDVPTTLNYTITPGSAVAGAGGDYSASSYTGTLSFSGHEGEPDGSSGALNAFIPIYIIDDDEDEPDQTFTIKLHDASPAGKITFPNGADSSEYIITIIDDDPANQAPTNITLSNTVIPEESGADYSVGTLTTTSNASDMFITHTYSIVGDAQGFKIAGSQLQTAKNFDFELEADRGPFTIKVKAKDDGSPAESIEIDFVIAIDTLNDNAPIQKDTTVTIAFGKATVIKIPTPTDIDFPTSTVAIDSTIATGGVVGATVLTKFGVVTYLGEGSYSYTPEMATLETADEFTYQLLDSTNYDAANVHRVTAKVLLVLDQSSKLKPVARDDSLSLLEGGIKTINVMADNGFGADTVLLGDAIVGVRLDTASIYSAYPEHGTVELLADGTLTYTHNDSENFEDIVRYEVIDAGGKTGKGAVYIVVNPLNDNVAIISNEVVTVLEDSTIAVTVISAEEKIADVDIETILKVTSIIKNGVLGTAVITDSSIIYTQNGDVIASGILDTVIVSVSDAVAYDAVNTHLINDTIFITTSPKMGTALSASYFDTDELADGIVDRVIVEFDHPIDVANSLFSLTWADSTQIVTPIPTTNETSSTLIFDGLYTDTTKIVKTSGAMFLTVTHSAIFGGVTTTTEISDRAAPVIVSAYMDAENISDTTLTLTFSEDIVTVESLVNYPYSFFDQDRRNAPFTMDLVYQLAPTPNSVKYLASNISINYVVTGDSVAIEFGNYIYDTTSNEQLHTAKTLLETSFKYELDIRLLVYPQPLVLEEGSDEIIRTKNIDPLMYEFYNLDEIGIAPDAGVCFIIEATGPLSVEENHRGRGIILDNVGNVVSEEFDFKFVVKEDGDLAGVAIWDAKNRTGRIVGRGAYLVQVEAFLIFGDDDKKTKKLIKTVGIKY
jgi:hypothetical protein